jgi:predicted Zn-dependent protease
MGLRLRPNQKAAEILLAEVEAREGRTADAVNRLEGVLKSSPGSVLAMERLAGLYSTLGESARAHALWAQVLKADPANRDARTFLTTHPAGAGR